MKKLSVLGLLLVCAGVMFAEDQDEGHWPVTLGLKGGAPITGMFSASNTGILGPSVLGNSSPTQVPGSFSAHTPRYIIGASAEFRVPFHH